MTEVTFGKLTFRHSLDPPMYLVPIAWLYVTLMMAIVEATGSNGSLLGALVTFVMYGVLPVALVMYLLMTPSRRRAQRARELAQDAANTSADPDAGGHAAAATEDEVVAPVREKP
jgi:hypothetical protein